MNSNEMIIKMTVGELQQIIVQTVREVVSDAMSRPQEPKTITTIKTNTKIAKFLDTSTKNVTHLMRCGILGKSLWQKQTDHGNSPIYFDTITGVPRYRYLQMMQDNEREAWKSLSADEVEAEWQRLNM